MFMVAITIPVPIGVAVFALLVTAQARVGINGCGRIGQPFERACRRSVRLTDAFLTVAG